MKKFLLTFFVTAVFFFVPAKFFGKKMTGNSLPEKLEYKIIPSEGNTWGYDILKEGALIVHQPNIPGMPGNKGFTSKIGAENIARLVIEKIKKGQMPPIVTPEEMKELKAI